MRFGIVAGSMIIAALLVMSSTLVSLVCAHSATPSALSYNSAEILSEGQPINAHVDRSSSRFYNFTLSDLVLRRDLTISCTRRSGDPDMFVVYYRTVLLLFTAVHCH